MSDCGREIAKLRQTVKKFEKNKNNLWREVLCLTNCEKFRGKTHQYGKNRERFFTAWVDPPFIYFKKLLEKRYIKELDSVFLEGEIPELNQVNFTWRSPPLFYLK